MRNDIDRMYSALIEKGFIDDNTEMMLTRERPYIFARIAMCYCLHQMNEPVKKGDRIHHKIGLEMAKYFGRDEPFERTSIYHTVKTGSFALIAPYGPNKLVSEMIDAIAEIKPIGINSRRITRPIKTPVYCV